MNPSALESKIRELAAAGQIIGHHHDCDHVRDGADECTCGTVEHDAAVEQALAEALAELEKLTRKLDECVWPEEHEEELIWWLSKGIDAAGAAWLTPRMLREAKRMETP